MRPTKLEHEFEPIPEGHQIYASLEVAGISYRKRAAQKFAKGRDQYLDLQRESGNRHDPNAIRVIGCWRGWFRRRRAFIGYVPADAAAAVAAVGAFDVVFPRLRRTYQSQRGNVQVYFQLTGPKAGAREFKAALREA